jgi:hypothetical protein
MVSFEVCAAFWSQLLNRRQVGRKRGNFWNSLQCSTFWKFTLCLTSPFFNLFLFLTAKTLKICHVLAVLLRGEQAKGYFVYKNFAILWWQIFF